MSGRTPCAPDGGRPARAPDGSGAAAETACAGCSAAGVQTWKRGFGEDERALCADCTACGDGLAGENLVQALAWASPDAEAEWRRGMADARAARRRPIAGGAPADGEVATAPETEKLWIVEILHPWQGRFDRYRTRQEGRDCGERDADLHLWERWVAMTVRGEVVYDGMSVRAVRETARRDAPAALRGENRIYRLALGEPSA